MVFPQSKAHACQCVSNRPLHPQLSFLCQNHSKTHLCISLYYCSHWLLWQHKSQRWAKIIGCPRCHTTTPHTHRTKSKTLCHTSAWDILDVIALCVFSGMLVQQIHSFFTPATHNAPFNGLPGQGSQRIRLNKQVRRMISKFGQSLNLFCASTHESLSYITILSPHS